MQDGTTATINAKSRKRKSDQVQPLERLAKLIIIVLFSSIKWFMDFPDLWKKRLFMLYKP